MILFLRTIRDTITLNPLRNVPHHIETSQLVRIANQLTSFYMGTLVVNGFTRTKILSKFQIISKLTAIKSCAYLSELPGTVFGGSSVPMNRAVWSSMCETRERVLLF